VPILPIPPLPSPPTVSNQRTANDLLVEISGHLVEDVVNATLTEPAVPSPTATLFVTSTVGMYVGAQAVLAAPDGSDPTIFTIATFDPTSNTITGALAEAYPQNSTLLGGTFPTQQPSDPLFTQAEVLGYLARAQNEFLSKVPCIYQFSSQTVDAGEELQSLPPTAIELERVSINQTRLYEISQSQLTMSNPQWPYAGSPPTPTNWYEDRAGYYGWGLNPVPGAQFTCVLVTSQRGPDVLALTDLFIVPDPMIHAVKYKALEYAWSKDGENRSPTMMRIAQQRFDSLVAICTRFMIGVVDAAGK